MKGEKYIKRELFCIPEYCPTTLKNISQFNTHHKGRNIIHYQHDISTRTIDLTTTKTFWNRVLSNPGAEYLCVDLESLYLYSSSSSEPASVTPYHVHYWVMEAHPKTAAIRSLDYVPLMFIVYYVCNLH